METVLMRQPKANLCLQFSDTVEYRNNKERDEHLVSFESLVAWSVEKGAIGRQEATKLSHAAKVRHVDSSTFKRALELREAIYRIFSAVAHGKMPLDPDLMALNGVLADASVTHHVTRKGDRFEWEWDVDNTPQSLLLWPIAKSAADLLTSEELNRVRECANEEEGCGWVFMDTTKSRTKRYCSADGCGNRAKVRAWYERNATKPV